MDNSWQQMKCSSLWPSQPPLPPPPQLPSSSASRNQMDVNVGEYLYPYIAQHAYSTEYALVPEPLVFSTLNLGSCKSGKPEVGNSFLALLSGHPQHLESDFQQLLNPKAPAVASKLPIHSIDLVSSSGCAVPVTRIAPLPELRSNESIGNAVALHSEVTSRVLPTSTHGEAFVLHNNLNTPNLNLSSSGGDSTKAVSNDAIHGNEIEMEGSSLRLGQLVGAGFPNPIHHHTTSIQNSLKLPSDVQSTSLVLPCASARGKPRVFCLGTSGDLLLSDTGFLGVVCSCHGLPMSVAKFCEHAGSYSINPGEAVCLESGETVAQWCRGCFLKFGMRIPEDINGWDWPNGIRAPASMVKGKTTTMSNMSKNSDLFGGSTKLGQSWNDSIATNSFYHQKDFVEKSVNKVVHNGQQSNSMEEHKILKGFAGTLQSILPSSAGNQMLQAVRKSSTLASKVALDKAGKNNCLPSIDFVSKGGNPFITDPNFRVSKSFGTANNVNSCSNLREAFVMDMDSAFQSNIELRLGQPSQQSRTVGDSTLPSVRPLASDSQFDVPKSRFCVPLVHKAVIPRVTDEFRQNQLHNFSDVTNSSGREKNSELDLVCHALRSLNAMDPVKLEQLKGDATKSSQISMFLSHFINPTEGNMQSHDSDSHIVKCNPIDLSGNRTGLNSKLNMNPVVHSNSMDKGKGSSTVSDNCHVVAQSNTSIYKQMSDSDLFAKAVNGHWSQSTSVVNDKIYTANLHQSARMPMDTSDARNFSHQFQKAPCLEGSLHQDYVLSSLRSGSASVTAASGIPVGGFSLPNLMNLSNKKSNDVSQHMLDENLSLLALRHLVELSEQKNPTGSLQVNQEQGWMYCNSVTDMPRRNMNENLIASEELRDGYYITHKQDPAIVAARSLQSFCNNYSSDGYTKPGMAGEKNFLCSSTSKHRIPSCSNELGVSPLPCHDCGANDQPSLRLGRIGNKVTTDSCQHEGWSEKELNCYLPWSCSCAIHSACLTQSCVSMGGTSINASKHAEYVCGKAPTLFDKDNQIPRDQRDVLGRGECLKRHCAQWVDVPSKVTENCNSNLIERPAKVLDGKEAFEDQFEDTAAKGCVRMSDGTESLKEQQMSNVCSIFSPAVTEVSTGVKNVDSCIMDDGEGGYAHDLVIDEGSGIEKCSSSDDALGSDRWAQNLNVLGKATSTNECCSSKVLRKSSHDLIDEQLTNTFLPKESRSRIQNRCTVQEHTCHTRQFEHGLKAKKGRKTNKWKSLEASFSPCLSPVHGYPSNSIHSSEPFFHFSKEVETSLHDEEGAKKRCCICTCGPLSIKRKRSSLSSTKSLSRKRNLRGLEDYHGEWEDDHQTQLSSDIYFNRLPICEISAEKKAKQDLTADSKGRFSKKDSNHVDDGKMSKYMSFGFKTNLSYHVDTLKKAKPVVCGNLGIISDGKLADGLKKPAKIISLKSILKVAKRCTISESDIETRIACLSGNDDGYHDEWSLKKEGENQIHRRMSKASFSQSEGHNELSILKKGKCIVVQKATKLGAVHYNSSIQMKRYKETRKRSLYELTGEGKSETKTGSSILTGDDFSQIVKAGLRFKAFSGSALVNALHVKRPSSTKICSRRKSKCPVQTYFVKTSPLRNIKDYEDHPGELSQPNSKRSSIRGSESDAYVMDSDAVCCVCGTSDKDEFNHLLECNRCSIRVHQACYGVPKSPRGHWCCRPCRTNSKNIACVLCGYEGGAMTRALKSRNIVRGLLEAWKVGEVESESVNSIPPSGVAQYRMDLTIKSGAYRLEESELIPLTRPMNVEPSSSDVSETDLEMKIVRNTNGMLCNFQIRNTITAGVHDPTIMQWVHMVCGLWTPGTRCPNVHTMSAFDVSGASSPKKNMVCSICSRPGGSCIKCRFHDCSIHFHPWCAHQKGLLQSEVEGVNNDKVGFYGRCLVHATDADCYTNDRPGDARMQSPIEKGFTCARTEGYKGRKRGEGFRHSFHLNADGDNGCLVPPEQINAWLHINGQKSCIRGLVKSHASDIEHDCRKEYARYKQAQGWRHLVVYKSGIHALGLYTSQFISRGAMVVEYVGEIVGLRVADKREIEYQSGRKVQYKSACYFFRIDKEHIIDATRKGGIARFVNHSSKLCCESYICEEREKGCLLCRKGYKSRRGDYL